MATRIDGATWTTRCFLGFLISLKTLEVASTYTIAPVGQTATHWPQKVQDESASGRLKAGETMALKPRFRPPRVPTV